MSYLLPCKLRFLTLAHCDHQYNHTIIFDLNRVTR